MSLRKLGLFFPNLPVRDIQWSWDSLSHWQLEFKNLKAAALTQ
jgi:hypothetical protein